MRKSLGALIGAALLCCGVACSLVVDGSDLSSGCPDGTKECAGACVSVTDADFGCGGPGCSPCALNRATATCSPAGECAVASCVGVYEDCDRNPNNGCEVNTDQDPMNCGRCEAACPPVQEAEVACGNASCYILSCSSDSGDCNHDLRDGCETDLSTNRQNCGQCGHACSTACEDALCQSDR